MKFTAKTKKVIHDLCLQSIREIPTDYTLQQHFDNEYIAKNMIHIDEKLFAINTAIGDIDRNFSIICSHLRQHDYQNILSINSLCESLNFLSFPDEIENLIIGSFIIRKYFESDYECLVYIINEIINLKGNIFVRDVLDSCSADLLICSNNPSNLSLLEDLKEKCYRLEI